MNENQEESKIRPLGMFVLSFDNLCFTKIDQSLNTRWSIHPPLFKEYGNKADKRDTLKAMCRKGVPPALRQGKYENEFDNVNGISEYVTDPLFPNSTNFLQLFGLPLSFVLLNPIYLLKRFMNMAH